jgi:ParB/RepB/Spo0J family partition protein
MSDGKSGSRGGSEEYQVVDFGLIDLPEESDRFGMSTAKLEELTESIREVGIIQPLTVNKKGKRFMLIAGKRRMTAAKNAGLESARCVVKNVDEKTAMIMRATENLQREDLSPIEEGLTYTRLYDKEGLSRKMIARRMGKSEYHVQRKMELMKLDEEIQKAIHSGNISEGVGLELSKIEDKKDLYRYLEIAVENGVTVQVAKLWTDDYRRGLQYIARESPQGGGLPEIEKQNPVYAACDLCAGPVEYKDMKMIRVCGTCYEILKSALNQGVFNK